MIAARPGGTTLANRQNPILAQNQVNRFLPQIRQM
jgi:hypothetical protein